MDPDIRKCPQCGDTEDLVEFPIRIDQTWIDYALECGNCNEVWAL